MTPPLIEEISIDPKPWVKEFKEFCLWVAAQAGLEIRWVILGGIALIVLYLFYRSRR